MVKTEWKSKAEIQYSLGNADRVSILSCAACANLCDKGGSVGIRILKKLLKEWNKEVVFSSCITACCSEEIMRQALKRHRRKISRSDALIVLSCSSGVKSACLCETEVPVIAVLDTVGITPITHQDNTLTRSLCTTCDHCVIAYTGGICPLAECPARKKYGPCKDYPKHGTQCAIDPNIDCVWKDIEKTGDLPALKRLEQLHKTEGASRFRSDIIGWKSPSLLRTIAGKIAARPGILEKVVRFIN